MAPTKGGVLYILEIFALANILAPIRGVVLVSVILMEQEAQAPLQIYARLLSLNASKVSLQNPFPRKVTQLFFKC